MNWINKLSLKDDTTSYCFTLFIYVADPATILASNSVSWDPIFLWEQLVYSVMDKMNSSDLYYELINIETVKLLRLSSFSETTSCPFKSLKPFFLSISRKDQMLSCTSAILALS